MTPEHVEGFVIGSNVAILYALWIFRTHVWSLFATWCLSYEGGKSVLSGMWLTEGDNCWGYIDGENGPWVTGRGWLP